MPIELTCICGKRLRVADEFANRQGQCPVCGDLLQIPGPDPTMTASSPESSQAVTDDRGLDELFGPGAFENAVTPAAKSAPDMLNKTGGDLQEDDNSRLTVVGYVLTLITVAIIFGVAIPIVRWRDPATGRHLPRMIAIVSPLMIGAAFNGLATLLLRIIGLKVWSKKDKDA
jgi:hypothetical protein